MTITFPFPSLDTLLQLIALGGWIVCLVLFLQLRARVVALSRHAATVQRTSRLARYRQWLRDNRSRSTIQSGSSGSNEPVYAHDGVIDVDAYLREPRQGESS